ncbi:MAG: histidine--tRNA ligase [Bacteroidia bacterium]|jgi:histidyl-tRNA synthetase|nr:histidine--tRNA ligase [Bacteroidia bacterium]
MAANKPTIPKGTRDFGPAEVQKRKYILNTIEGVFKKYGFMPIETPTMENLTTLEGKYGDEGDKLLFRILDSGSFDHRRNLLISYTVEIIRKIISDTLKDVSSDYKNAFNANIRGIDGHFISYNQQITPSDKKTIAQIILEVSNELFSNLNDIKSNSDHVIDKLISIVKPTIESYFNLVGNVNPTNTEKGLRYDLTVPFARYVVMNRNEITFPFKRYQMQPVWRADRPQKGRYREFWQCDADVVGSDSLLNEVDLIQIYDEAFTKLGITHYELRMNNRKVLAGIAEVVKSVEYMNTIAVAIDKLDKIGEEGVRKELSEQKFSESELDKLFEIISIKGENEVVLNTLKTKLQHSAEGIKGINELEFIIAAIQPITQTTSQQINLKLDFSLARGLSYYTGAIFEVVSTEGSLKSSIGGGGRYDNLTGIFGLPNVSGVGISFGLDRIYDVMEELKLFPNGLNTTSTRVLICTFDQATQAYALAPLRQLRDAGIAAELYPDLKKLGKQLDYANALHIPYAMIIGDTEMQSGKLVLKDLTKGTQQELSINEIVDNLK